MQQISLSSFPAHCFLKKELRKDLDSRKSVSAGVACFPFSDFKKSTTPYNCRKALSHAAFFGKSGMALFDAVSLNITGDIYFSDGDFVKAVTEYKRGVDSRAQRRRSRCVRRLRDECAACCSVFF